jgi:E3 ubiquitin-protein ligase listerin
MPLYDLFSIMQVLKLLSDNATSTPQSLGDARKESPEELQFRHESVLAATCALLGSIIKNSKKALEAINSSNTTTSTTPTTSSSSNNNIKQLDGHLEILEGCKSLLNNAAFLKITLQSKSPLVRRSAYNLIASVCHNAPEMISNDAATLALFSPLVFGCLGEKESGNHSLMWNMILSFASATTCARDSSHSSACSAQSWSDHVNLNKAVLPKLWSLLRHGCYGSAEGSYPAVLPFINLLVQNTPPSSFGLNGFESLLSAVYGGCLSLVEASAGQEAAATCFIECYLYAIVKAEQLTEGGEEGAKTFCEDLITAVVESKCLVDAVGGVHSNISIFILVNSVSKLAEHARNSTTSSRWKVDLVISSIGTATAEATFLALENLNAPGAPSLAAIENLLLGIKHAVGGGEDNEIAVAASRPVVTALLPYVHSSSSTASSSGGGGGKGRIGNTTAAGTAAAALLAALVKAMPELNLPSASSSAPAQLNKDFSAVHIDNSPSFTPESILTRIIGEQQTGAPLTASCDLITCCLLQQQGYIASSELENALMVLMCDHSEEAATALLSQFISSASEEKIEAMRSPELSSFCMDLVESLQHVNLCIMLLLGNGRTTSFVDEVTQTAAFDNISESIETSAAMRGTFEPSGIECAMLIISATVFSPVFEKYTDISAVVSRLRAVAAAFVVLVDEACKAATLADDRFVEVFDDSDQEVEEENDDEMQHSHSYSLALGLWSMPEKISPLLAQSDSGGIAFVDSLSHCISTTLASCASEENILGIVYTSNISKACLAAANCTKLALDAMSENVELFSKIFLHLIAKAISPYGYYTVFFSILGDVIGWQRLLTVLGDGSLEAEAKKNSELISKILLSTQFGGEPPAMLIAGLLENPKLLEMVLKKLAEVDNSDAFSQLLCAALSSSNDEAINIGTTIFRSHGLPKVVMYVGNKHEEEGNIRRSTPVPVLPAVAPILRSSEKLLIASELPKLAADMCAQGTDPIISNKHLRAIAAACFPAPFVAPPVPRWAPSSSSTAAAITPSFAVGDFVWYRHRDGGWEASEVVSIDTSVDPPSFAVKLATGVRETESGRLVARNADEAPPLTSGTGEGSAYTFDALSGNRSRVVPVCCLDEEKRALLELFRYCFAENNDETNEEEALPTAFSDASAAILCSAIAWCASEFTQADWEIALNALHVGMDAAAVDAATAAVAVATVVTKEAEKVAGAALGGAEPSLAFFRQLNHKKILVTSTKGAAAAQAIATSVNSSLENFYTENGSKIGSLLQAYCTASKLIATSARTCPFMTWEASQAAVCAAVLDIFISLGKIVALAGGCGQSDSITMHENYSFGMKDCWNQVSLVVDATVAAADRAFLAVVVERAGGRRSDDGVGCTEALVALSLDSNTPGSAQNGAYRSILLHSELVLDLVRSIGAGDDDDSADLLDSGATARKDWYEELESGGLLPDIATAASNPDHPCFTTAWGYIVAFLLHSRDSSTARTKLVERIKEAHGLVHAVLDDVLPLLPLGAAAGGGGNTPGTAAGSRRSVGGNASNNASSSIAIFGAEDTSGQGFSHHLCALGVPGSITSTTTNTISSHAALLYAGMLRALPVLCRLWYGDLRDKSTLLALEKYTSTAVSSGLLAAEYAAVDELVKGLDRFEKFSVRANSASREVVASMEVEDGHMIELVIKLPASMPLKAPEAECKKSVGVSEARLRKWLLSITAFLRNRNGAIADALRLWKRNVDTEFEGHDDCLICYSIIQPSTGQLPRLACRCCRKKYHGTCLYKWFHSSGKSNCPHCQSPW